MSAIDLKMLTNKRKGLKLGYSFPSACIGKVMKEDKPEPFTKQEIEDMCNVRYKEKS